MRKTKIKIEIMRFFFLAVEKRLVEIETPFDAPSFAFGLDWMRSEK